ncbi:MAG TPA: DUF3467 domain-containing protein [Syntrophales bacterium]|nr:DUF3467 domain-containing protein [Syntrophales bacterium]HPC33140.1 DUF3467 domain-containing protein [Syntrophales bacterium]
MMANQPHPEQSIQINTGDEIVRGRYSNTLLIGHGPEEFILDWLLSSPSGTHLVSRVIVSPGHVRRIIDALTFNLKQYEQKFGPVKVIEPAEQKMH